MKNSLKFLLLAFALFSLSFVTNDSKVINVVIDAGHGGDDHGATFETFKEKEIAEIISKKIQALNSDTDVKIHFTRHDDSPISLSERADLINEIKPDLAISLHINNNKNTTTRGFEVYVSDQSNHYEKSSALAEKLISKLAEKSPLNNRGVKKAPFMVLKKADCPSLLVEFGFISNETDRNYLTSEKGQTEMAQTILEFVSDLKQ